MVSEEPEPSLIGAFREARRMFRAFIASLLPAAVRRKRIVLAQRKRLARASELVEALPEARKGDPLRPEKALVEYLSIGAGDFESIGRQVVEDLRDLCRLRQTDRILDIGCGIGRIAIPLTQYLGASGAYNGFDVAPAGVNWCAKRITPQFSNFQFDKVDVYNPEYNPTGRLAADSFVFPYEDNAFDCALAASVFTHMRPASIQRFIHEASRVLKPGGRCLFTFFVLDEASRSAIANGNALFRFEHEFEGFFSDDRDLPERAIAYDEADIRRMLANAGLDVVEPLHYGTWSGRGVRGHGQDVVVVQHR